MTVKDPVAAYVGSRGYGGLSSADGVSVLAIRQKADNVSPFAWTIEHKAWALWPEELLGLVSFTRSLCVHGYKCMPLATVPQAVTLDQDPTFVPFLLAGAAA